MDYTRALELVGEHGTPALFLSAGRLRENYRELEAALPGVSLYYAIKANPLPQVVSILEEEGSCFDIASSGEIEVARSCGIDGSRCIHTNPIKRDSDIRAALDFGITTFVADNPSELVKFAPYRDSARVLIRLSIQNPQCLVNLSHKFGVRPEQALDLIRQARDQGLTVEGIAFHCGSQNENVLKYTEALDYCRDICRMAAVEGCTLNTIDIGGGFPVDYVNPVTPIAQFCQPINEYLERYFATYRIIAEPGRYICGQALTLATRVIGKSVREGIRWYYIDDGLYGSFSGKVFDHADYPMYVPRSGERYTSTIAGPTCDSIDIPYENIALPELEVGDVLLFGAMGAYTNATSTQFNGLPPAKVVAVE